MLHGISNPSAASQTRTSLVISRKCFLLSLCIALFLFISGAISFSQENEVGLRASRVSASPVGGPGDAIASAIDLSTLPQLSSIDAQTNLVAVFQPGVPAELRRAALRRAWTTDPAIRDFKGLQESDWDFNDPNSIPGFGTIGPEVDIKAMVARIFGETSPVLARADSPVDIALRFLQRSLSPTPSAAAHD